jgi:SAM-dependent methyltransferase
LGETAQYGWGHTINFGAYEKVGILGDAWLRMVGACDEWGWWPQDLSGRVVADVGCFTGGVASLLAGRGAERVYAVDELEAHVDQCLLVAKTFGLDAVEPVRASLYGMNHHVPPGTVDVIFAGGLLYHLSDMLVGLLELREALQDGGTLILETNAVEDWERSYANYGRYVGGMWWQPTALAIQDMLEAAGFSKIDIRFYRPGRCLVRATRTGDPIVNKRGLNWAFDSLDDDVERSMDLGAMKPAIALSSDFGMIRRFAFQAVESLLRLPMRLGYLWKERRRHSSR